MAQAVAASPTVHTVPVSGPGTTTSRPLDVRAGYPRCDSSPTGRVLVSGRNTGVDAYEIGDDFIRIQFGDGSVYLYDVIRPGSKHVEQMKILLGPGKG